MIENIRRMDDVFLEIAEELGPDPVQQRPEGALVRMEDVDIYSVVNTIGRVVQMACLDEFDGLGKERLKDLAQAIFGKLKDAHTAGATSDNDALVDWYRKSAIHVMDWD